MDARMRLMAIAARVSWGGLSSALGAASVWMLLRGVAQPWWGLVAAALGFLAVWRVGWAMLITVPVALTGIAWPLMRMAAMAMIAAVGFAILLRPKGIEPRLRPAHAVAGVFTAALVLSCAWPHVVSKPMRHFDLTTLLLGIAVFAICAAVRLSVKGFCVAVTSAGVVVAGLVLTLGRFDPAIANWQAERLSGLGQNPNGLGLLVTMPLVAAVGLAWHRRKAWWLLAAAPMAAVLVLTESRGATVAAACGIAYVFLAGRRWWWQTSGLAAAVMLALGVCQVFYVAEPPLAPTAAASVPAAAPTTPSTAPTTPSTAPTTAPVLAPAALAPTQSSPPRKQVSAGGSRKAKDLEHNNTVRMRAALLAARTSVEYPLRGIGYGSFASYAKKVPGFGIHMNTHNEYLRMSAEAGLPALAALVGLLWLGLRRRGTAGLAIPRAIVVCFAAGLMFGTPLSNVALSIAFWGALGILIAYPPAENHVDDSQLSRA